MPYSLKQVSNIPYNRALVTLEALIIDSDQQLDRRVEDSFLIRNLKAGVTAKTPTNGPDRHEPVGLGLRKREPTLEPTVD